VSVTAVSLLIVAGICCLVLMTVLFAVLRAAALGDRALERYAAASRQPASNAEEDVLGELGRRRTGRFARRARDRASAPDAQDTPVRH